MNKNIAVAVVFLLGGCAGKVDYLKPASTAQVINAKLVERPRDAVWDATVPELGKRFFVINNLDKSSGLINVSYTGDPEQYVDCGQITSYVKNARGERTYQFPASRGVQNYEILENGLFYVQRKMNLEGRVNLIFEDAGPNQTRVTANTRYVLTRQVTIRNAANNIPQTLNDSISLNTGSSASFPGNSRGESTECVSTGRLEQELLSAIK